MRMRTFTAPDMPTAMQMVRESLGENAIILSSDAGKGKRSVSITAAVEEQDEPVSPPPHLRKIQDTGKLDDIRHEMQTVLRFHNIPELFISKMLRFASDRELEALLALDRASARSDDDHLLRQAMEKVFEHYFHFEPLMLHGPTVRLMLVGTPGIGKTLTIAKIAAQLAITGKSERTKNLSIITTDDKRAGGIEQLQAFTDILGLTLHIAKTAKDIQEHVQSLPASTHVLVDTAGCNPYDGTELQELRSFASIRGIEPILVLPAGGDSSEAIDMVENFMVFPIKRFMVTRADTTRRFGGILSVAAAHGLSFANLSGSSSIIDPPPPINGALLAQYLLKYRSRSH